MYAAAEKIKGTVTSWLLIEETCTSTSAIDLVQQWVMKADLNLKSVYRENMKLSKYFDDFMVQAKVAWETGVNSGSEAVVSLIQDKLHEKDGSVSEAPVYRNPLIKLDCTMYIKELWEVIKYNTFCQK